MSSNLKIISMSGKELSPWLDKLGQLRITVFNEFPYLYEGDLEYERKYLDVYLKSPSSFIVLVLNKNEDVVGATTCLKLIEEGAELQKAFKDAHYNLNDVCYFGESLLLPELRGLGLGKEFFKLREDHAQKLGSQWTTFCAVNRSPDHPRRPPHYQPLDTFWIKQGYTKHPELQAQFTWKEIGEAQESPKSLTFWLKEWPQK